MNRTHVSLAIVTGLGVATTIGAAAVVLATRARHRAHSAARTVKDALIPPGEAHMWSILAGTASAEQVLG